MRSLRSSPCSTLYASLSASICSKVLLARMSMMDASSVPNPWTAFERGQPLSLALSFGEIPWFDARGERQRCDWSKRSLFSMCPAQYKFSCYGFFRQSHRRITTHTVHQTTEFRQTIVRAKVVDPSHHALRIWATSAAMSGDSSMRSGCFLARAHRMRLKSPPTFHSPAIASTRSRPYRREYASRVLSIVSCVHVTMMRMSALQSVPMPAMAL